LTPAQMQSLDQQLPITATSDVTGRIIPNGAKITVTTTSNGQKGRLGFDGATGQQANVQLSGNTIGSVTVSLLDPTGAVVATTTSSATSFSLPGATLATTGNFIVSMTPTGGTSGSISVTLTGQGGTTQLPYRPAGAVLDTSNLLSTKLVGLFIMNEGSGTTDTNLVDSQVETFAGSTTPTWDVPQPSVVLYGDGSTSLYSYLNDTTPPDLAFDKIPISQVTIVAKVYITEIFMCGVAEKNDGNSSTDSGFVFGWDLAGSIHLTVEGSGNMRVSTNPDAVPAGQWVQVAFTWDGTQPPIGTAAAAHLFVSGVEQAKASSADGSGIAYAGATNQPFRIGNGSFDVSGSLFGEIAYMAVYINRILTPTEMNQLDTQLPIK